MNDSVFKASMSFLRKYGNPDLLKEAQFYMENLDSLTSSEGESIVLKMFRFDQKRNEYLTKTPVEKVLKKWQRNVHLYDDICKSNSSPNILETGLIINSYISLNHSSFMTKQVNETPEFVNGKFKVIFRINAYGSASDYYLVDGLSLILEDLIGYGDEFNGLDLLEKLGSESEVYVRNFLSQQIVYYNTIDILG